MRKNILFVTLINFLVLALIPVNLFLINIPSFAGILSAVILVVSYVLYFIKCGKGKNRISKITLCLLCLFTAFTILFFAFCFPYWNSATFKRHVNHIAKPYDYELTQKQALEDLDFAYKQVNRIHPAMLDKKGDDYKKLYAAYKTEREEILKKEKIQIVELNQHIQHIFSLLGDAHTVSSAKYEQPLYMKYMDEINNEDYSFKEINGVPYKDLLQQKKNLFSYESELWALKDLGDYAVIYQYLIYMGYDLEKGITYTLEKTQEKGEPLIKTLTVTKDDFLTVQEYLEYNKKYREKKNENKNDETEKAASAAGEKKSFCYYKIEPEHNAAIFTLTDCTNNAEYTNCLNNMFKEVREKGIGNVAVDVRNNGGGSSLVINSFIKYLDTDDFYEPTYSSRYGAFLKKSGSGHKKNHRKTDLLFTGNVYILTSIKSFSSAMMFPQMIKDNGLGKVIGQAPANNPNGYGDVVRFYMPNSRIYMQVSYKKFHRVNQKTTEKYIEPDYPCDSDEVFDVLYSLCD